MKRSTQLMPVLFSISLFVMNVDVEGMQLNYAEKAASALSINEVSSSDKQLYIAERLFLSSLYPDAIPCYEEVLQDLKRDNLNDRKDRATIRLCQAFLMLGDYVNANRVMEEHHSSNPTMVYLKALTTRLLKKPNRSLELITDYRSKYPTPNKSELSLLKLEEGISRVYIGDFNGARKVLTPLPSFSENDTIKGLSKIYLARIEIAQKEYRRADTLLSSIDDNVLGNAFLQFELLFLKGLVAEKRDDPHRALKSFNKLLDQVEPSSQLWSLDTYNTVGNVVLQTLDSLPSGESIESDTINKIDRLFETFYKRFLSEKSTLALGRYYIAKSRIQNNPKLLSKVHTLLNDEHMSFSKEAVVYAHILRAQASDSYHERDTLLASITEDSPESPYGWYYRGLNHYHEGHKHLSAKDPMQSYIAFKRASRSFKTSFDLLHTKNAASAGDILLLLIESLFREKDFDALVQAHHLLNNFILNSQGAVATSKEPAEFYLAAAIITMHLYDLEKKDRYLTEVQSHIETLQEKYPETNVNDSALHLLGTSYYMQRKFPLAEKTFLSLAELSPHSPLAGEALYWCGRCAQEQAKSHEIVRQYYISVYHQYPSSKYADAAFFLTYTTQEYLQGGRAPLKHLERFRSAYPNSPYILDALFLLGLDAKRDRRSPEGKWIAKKNLTKAIDLFYQMENSFVTFAASERFSSEQTQRYRLMRYRATLERAQANLSIAEHSEGAKREIFLEYAANVFNELLDTVRDINGLPNYNEPTVRVIIEEGTFGLATTYATAKNYEAAKKVLLEMVENYSQGNVTKGYYLSRGLYTLGEIAVVEGRYPEALDYFRCAEECGKGYILSIDQTLDIWIQMSECHRRSGDLDEAMAILSKVINEDAISGLRIKAMYLRAEIYALQNRHELARKQLAATSKMGGDWAKQATKKLEEDYGYHKHIR